MVSDIGGKSTAQLKVTGPVAAGVDSPGSSWENVWYNQTIDHVQIKNVDITMMSGEHQSFDYSSDPIIGVRMCVIQTDCSKMFP